MGKRLLEQVEAQYANERIAVLVRQTRAKVETLAEQLAVAADAGLIGDPQRAVNLHAVSHAAQLEAQAMIDCFCKAGYRISSALPLQKEIWQAHLLVDQIVRDAQSDHSAGTLADPPNHRQVLLELSRNVDALVRKLRQLETRLAPAGDEQDGFVTSDQIFNFASFVIFGTGVCVGVLLMALVVSGY